jgi:hypothetical protein
MTAPLKIAIASPARDMVHTAFAFALANMVAHTAAARPDITLDARYVQGTMIFDQRIKLARLCLELECSHILWLDTDMAFPSDTLLRLLSHRLDIVAVNYVTREIPAAPLAWAAACDTKWKRVPTRHESTGLEKVLGVGLGVMLTDIHVIQKLAPLEAPMFWFQYFGKNRTTQSEDYYFCRGAARQGFDIWIDHGLSKEIRHIGTFGFGHEHDPQPTPDLRGMPT